MYSPIDMKLIREKEFVCKRIMKKKKMLIKE